MRFVNGVAVPRVLTTAQAARRGLTRAQIRTELRRGNWTKLADGLILTRPDEPTRTDWIEAGIALAGGRCAVTGWDASRLHGVGDREPPSDLVVIATTSGQNRVVGGVRLTRTTRPFAYDRLPADAPVLPLTPYVRVPRAVIDTGLQERSMPRVRALVAAAVQRRRCRIDDLLREFASAPRGGSRLLREALGEVADGARSAAEAAALRKLRIGRVPAFELNVPILVDGRTPYCVDFFWRQLRAVLEIDSREYHFSPAQWQATLARHNRLSALGLAVVHYPPSQVQRPGWTREVEAWLRGRAAEVGVRYVPSGAVLTARPWAA